MFKRMVNLPFKVLGKAARAVQERENAAIKERYEEAVVSDAEADSKHVPKFDTPDDYQPADLTLTAAQVLERNAREGLVFLDVRSESRTRQLADSLHIPLNTLDIRLAELPPAGTPIIVYCEDGESSEFATRFLRFRGIDETWCLEGGLHAWEAAEGELETLT
jgi:rhodanese-related sulfurtransferase